ncbi:Uncharacterised protein (plasmid) [Mycoplasmopsis gallopavonis]|uniref:RamC N-terminal domain-containing protein n=1 Tax=Mycoplasmopsis gallopavonis TaxID=76629 RepID=A0A449B0F3_9BACT|nr:hypothetical protein [Mycoplasmopsis gallopavonis]VEU73208.1 Uncharacterised protein [Mycoplasmopsis gallopavonis]
MFIKSRLSLVNHDYTIHSDEIFTYLKTNESKVPEQGWKIHISADKDNCDFILDQVFEYLINMRLNFKFVKDSATYFSFLTDQTNLENAFKFLTIYLDSNARKILDDLYLLLKDIKGPTIVGDRRFKDSGVLFYRYGSNVPNKDQDNRRVFNLPLGIEDLQEQIEINDNFLLNGKYEIKALIKEKTTSSVYFARSIENNQNYIIKQARAFSYSSNNLSSIDLRENEVANQVKLNASFVPKFIEKFELENDYFYVWEFKSGIPLNIWKERYKIFIQNQIPKEFETELKDICEQLLAIYSFTKNQNYQINDFALSNFSYDRLNKKLYLIDLEHGYFTDANFKIQAVCNKECKIAITPKEPLKFKLGLLLANLLVDLDTFVEFNSSLVMFLKYFEFLTSKINLSFDFYGLVKELLLDQKFSNQQLFELLEQKPKYVSFKKWQNRKLESYLLEKMAIKSNQTNRKDLDSFLEIVRHITLNFDLFVRLKKVFWLSKTLVNIENNFSNSLEKDFISLIMLLFNGKKKETKFLITAFENFINTHVHELGNNLYAVKVDNYYSPYLDKGLALLINLLLYFKVLYKSNYFDNLIQKYLEAIANKHTYKQDFYNGNLGISFVLYNASRVFKNESYLEYAQNIIYELAFFIDENNTLISQNYISKNDYLEFKLAKFIYLKILKKKGKNETSPEKILSSI